MARITRLAGVVALIFLVLGPVVLDTPALGADAGAIFSPGPQMNQARNGHWSVSLPDGRVALLGGRGAGGIILNSAEIWNPATNTFTQTTMQAARWDGTCARLNDGRFLLAGGWSETEKLNSAEIFNPADNTFTATANMNYPRSSIGAATLADGRVLLAGPHDLPGELYHPSTGSFSLTNPLNTQRSDPVVLPTSDGKAVVLGGRIGKGAEEIHIEQVELYDPDGNSFSVLQPNLFPGETGWIVLSPTDWGSIPIAHQQLQDGRYLLLALRQVGTTTTYQTRLFTVDPATQAIAPLVITPALPDIERLPESISPQMIVHKSRNKAYLLLVVAASEIRLYTIDLNTLRRNQPGGSYVLSPGYYVAGAGSALLQDDRLFFTGGMDDVNTENPVKKTLFARVPVNCVPLNLLLQE